MYITKGLHKDSSLERSPPILEKKYIYKKLFHYKVYIMLFLYTKWKISVWSKECHDQLKFMYRFLKTRTSWVHRLHNLHLRLYNSSLYFLLFSFSSQRSTNIRLFFIESNILEKTFFSLNSLNQRGLKVKIK